MKKNKVIKSIILFLIYKFSFDLLYAKIIYPLYDYYGFTYHFELLKYSLLAIFTLFISVPTVQLFHSDKTSSMAILLFTFLYFIPGLTYITFIDVPLGFIFFYLLYWLLMLFWNRYMQSIEITKLKKKNALPLLILYTTVLFGTIIFISAKYTGLRLHFSLDDVYELRAEARSMNFSSIIKYLMSIFAITNPILILFFLIKQKKIITGSLVLIQLLLFSIGGHKFFLFSLIVTFVIYFFYNKERIHQLSIVFIILNISVFLESLIRNGKSSLVTYIQYRVQLIPNQISYYIYDFMQKNQFLYLRESILRHFGWESPYPKSIFFIIGENYYHNSFTRANNGMCGDAYSQFGFISVLFYPLLIILTFHLIKSFSKNLDPRIVFLTVFLYVFSFINGSFFTVFLTNGLAVTFIVIYLMSSFVNKKS